MLITLSSERFHANLGCAHGGKTNNKSPRTPDAAAVTAVSARESGESPTGGAGAAMANSCPEEVSESGSAGSAPEGAHSSGGLKDDVRAMPAARPLPAMTRAILRLASSILSSPKIAEQFLRAASRVMW